MKRTKGGEVYYNLVGGGVDKGETLEQALLRELKEEAGVQVKNPRLVFVEDSQTRNGLQHIFVCEYVGGEPALHPESSEAWLHARGHDMYEPMWMSIEDFKSCRFVSDKLRSAILEGLVRGFPASVIPLQ